jgi:hypothetical protein
LDFSSVFDYLLIHDTWNRRGVNVFLAHCLNEENCAKILHRSNILAIFGGSGQISVPGAPRSQAAPRHQWLPYESQGKLRPQNIDAFRSLLSHDIAKKHIDDVDEMGMTMLYRSSFLLHPEIVGLLLDAGADPSLPSTFDGSKFCPLQVCCSSARLIASQWFSSIGVFAREDDDVVDNDIQHPPWEELSHAMETATELVRCHEARGDKRFQGISRLSLAWSMLYLPEVERLTDLVVDVRMLGAQLGKSRPLTGKELTKALAKRRYFPLSIINADKEVNTIESGKQI